MKKRIALLFALAAAAAAPAFAADVGVSISVGQPGFYGHIDVGDFPAPALIYRQPVVIQQVPMGGPPLYLRVPPGHYKHWNKHCAEYDACGRQVYFVRDSWYNNVYAPRYRQQYGEEHRGERDHGHDQWREHGDDHEQARGHGDDHGHGRNHGHGHDD